MLKRLYPAMILLIASLFLLPATPLAHSALVGTVCIVPSTVTGCSPPPVFLAGPTSGSTIVAVNIQGSDSLNGFDVSVKTDPSVLSGVSVDLSSSILTTCASQGCSPFITSICINNVPQGSGSSCSPGVDGPGVVHVTKIVFSFTTVSPTTGNLFMINYSVLGTTTGSKMSYVASSSQCPTSSSPPSCVTIASPGGAADPENLQTATFINSGFYMKSSPGTLPVVQGSSGTSSISVNGVNGFIGTVGLVPSIVPVVPNGPGLKLSAISVSLSAKSSSVSSTLTVSTLPCTPTGKYDVTVTGTGGTLVQTANVTVTVAQLTTPAYCISATTVGSILRGTNGTSTITVSSLNGFVGAVSIKGTIASGAKGGVAPVLVPATTTVTLTAGGTQSYTLTIVTSSSGRSATSPGTDTLTLTGTAAKTSNAPGAIITIRQQVTILAPDFTVAANPTPLAIARPNSGTITITVTSLNTFSGPVTVTSTITGAKGSVLPTLSPATTTVTLSGTGTTASFTLTVSTTASTTPGTYTLTVKGVGGTTSNASGTTRTITVSVTVS